MKKLQYITDAEGQVTHVILPIDIWEQLNKQVQNQQKKAIDTKEPIPLAKGEGISKVTIKKEDLDKLIEHSDMGLDCYVNLKTGTVRFFTPRAFMEQEEEVEAFEEFKKEINDCILIVEMPSNESYNVMEDFAREELSGSFQEEVLQALNMRKPFRKFKDLVIYSEFVDAWDAYHKDRLKSWILKQIPGEVEID